MIESGMPKKQPSKAEREYMGRVAELGCAVCRRLGYGPTPAEVHHARTGTGGGRRSSHYATMPACPEHHRGRSGIHGLGTKGFEKCYGFSELELVEETRRLLAPH